MKLKFYSHNLLMVFMIIITFLIGLGLIHNLNLHYFILFNPNNHNNNNN